MHSLRVFTRDRLVAAGRVLAGVLPEPRRAAASLRRSRKAAVAIWIAMMIPGLLSGLALGVEMSSWAAAQVGTQRAADLAATAGAMNYLASGNNQKAATFAARMAQLNGGAGTVTPSWNPATATLTDNLITAQVVTGLKTGTDTALTVSVRRIIPAGVSSAFSSRASYTVTGTGTAELITTSGPGTGGQPCLLALSASGTISGQGSTYWTMPNCTVRSNGTVDVHGGGGPLTTAGIYAGGAVNIDTWIATTGGQFPTSGTIPDPYASNTALQTQMTAAAALTGVTTIACSNISCTGMSNGSVCAYTGGVVTCTLHPGNYGGITVGGGGPYVFNFQPGLYLFQGALTFAATSTINGTGGVTLIAAGGFSGTNSFTFNVSAPTPTEVANTGGITAIAVASQSTTTVSISGSAVFNVAGVAYFPNAIFDASGSNGSSANPSQGGSGVSCLEIIASSIKLSGYSDFNSNCVSLGATTFSSVAGITTTSARIVR